MITVEGLTKHRGGRAVVSDVTFRCEPGTVTGFLGPNGSVKTTTMRMLVGLSEPDRGAARILGGRYRDLPNPGRRVGILLDASAQHPGRRGREALAVSAQMMGVPTQRVETETRRSWCPDRCSTLLIVKVSLLRPRRRVRCRR
jgi:ABC-2 type transport system ATP-binding protein